MKFIASLILVFLAGFTGTALASDLAATPEVSDVIQSILNAVVHGQWWPTLCATVVLLCALEIRYAPESWKAGAKGRVIGTAAAFVMAFAATLGGALAAPGAAFTTAVALTALKVGVGAIGGYHALSTVVDWLSTLALPAWAKTVLNAISAVIGRSAVKKAEAAGDAAVAAAPGPGMAGDGTMREVD